MLSSVARCGIRFEFWFRPLEDIEPWGDEGRKKLHWFALTDGFYRVVVDGKELFEYDASLFSKLGWQRPSAPKGFEHGVEYQVARLFQDLGEIVRALEGDPVPAQVAKWLATPDDRKAWDAMIARAAERDDEFDTLSLATGWLDDRTLDSLHLRTGPTLRLWQSHAGVHAWCNNQGLELEGHRAWAHEELYVLTPPEQFFAEVASFRSEFLAAMHTRVRQIEAGWTREGVDIDIPALRDEQSRYAASSSAPPIETTDWDEVSEAIEALARG